MRRRVRWPFVEALSAAALAAVDRTQHGAPPAPNCVAAESRNVIGPGPVVGSLASGPDFLGSECTLRTVVRASRHDAEGHHDEYRDYFEYGEDDQKVHGVHEKSHDGVQEPLDARSLPHGAAGPISEESPIHDSVR